MKLNKRKMKKLLLLSIALLLMSFSCSKEELPITDCNCKEIRYTLDPGDITYQYHSTVDMPNLNCEDENSIIHYNGFYHVKIECN